MILMLEHDALYCSFPSMGKAKHHKHTTSRLKANFTDINGLKAAVDHSMVEARTTCCEADHDVCGAAAEPPEGEWGDCGPHVEGLPDGSLNVLPLHVRGEVFYPGSRGKNITLE